MLVLGAGCRQKVDPEVFASAQAAFDDAEKKYANREFQQAAAAYETAIAQGGLNVDLYCTAQIRRAESLVRLGQYDKATEILDLLEQGAPDLAPVHIVRCLLFEKQGKTQEAAAQYRQARQYDSQIQKLIP
jgi:tetratricopeptide (TPR) repeat protein